jgi:hypothetical protein
MDEWAMCEHEVKAAVRLRDGGRCTACGRTDGEQVARTGQVLQVHRKEPGTPYLASRCVLLCPECHASRPGGPPWGTLQIWLRQFFPPEVVAPVLAYIDGRVEEMYALHARHQQAKAARREAERQARAARKEAERLANPPQKRGRPRKPESEKFVGPPRRRGRPRKPPCP